MVCRECDGSGIVRYVSGDGHSSYGRCEAKDCKNGLVVNEWNEHDESLEPVPPEEQPEHKREAAMAYWS